MARPEKRGKEEKKESRSLAQRRPAPDLTRRESEMERMLGDFFSPWWRSRRGPSMPAVDVDVYEENGEIVAKAELPGIDKDEISVEVRDHRLTIKGEKKKKDEVQDQDYYYSERTYGAFMRTIELPAEVQTDKAKAIFKDGVLEIRLPKTERAKKKQISINVQ